MAKKKKASVDPRQEELRELIELKKARQAAAEHREVEVETPLVAEEKIVPRTFKEKWDNYWYHYKALTWGGLFAVVMVVWLVKDIFFAQKPDLTINIATGYNLSSFNDSMDEDLTPYLSDYNGDGELAVIVSEMSLAESSDPQMMIATQQKFIAVLAAGDELIYLLDQQGYDYINDGSDSSMFINMEALYPGLEIADEDKLYITDLPLGKKWKLDRLGDEDEEADFFLCVRYLGNSARDNEENQETLRRCLDFIQNLVAESYPEWEGNQPVYDPATMNMT